MTDSALPAQRPVAILLAWLMLSEGPPLLAFAGGALCIGVVVARSRGRLPTLGRAASA
jgi:hypothetical protein